MVLPGGAARSAAWMDSPGWTTNSAAPAGAVHTSGATRAPSSRADNRRIRSPSRRNGRYDRRGKWSTACGRRPTPAGVDASPSWRRRSVQLRSVPVAAAPRPGVTEVPDEAEDDQHRPDDGEERGPDEEPDDQQH